MKKAFDQTVRDLKREVNKKVLKVPGIEQKILDVTSNEAWGPHGSHLADIALASRNQHEYQLIMSVIWRRISDTGKNWRHVYKGLVVLQYLVEHGSGRVIDELREHAYQISSLSNFRYIDSSGRDQGIHVRKKSQMLVALVSDKGRLQAARQKVSSNQEKSVSFLNESYSAYGGERSKGQTYGEENYQQRKDNVSSETKNFDRHRSHSLDNGDHYLSRHLEHPLPENSGSAPPSYEEATREAQNTINQESTRNSKTSEEAASLGAEPTSLLESTSQDASEKLDPHVSVPGTTSFTSSPTMDLIGSFSEDSTSSSSPIPAISSGTQSDLPPVLGFNDSSVPVSFASAVPSMSFEDPFRDSPFKAFQESILAQPQGGGALNMPDESSQGTMATVKSSATFASEYSGIENVRADTLGSQPPATSEFLGRESTVSLPGNAISDLFSSGPATSGIVETTPDVTPANFHIATLLSDPLNSIEALPNPFIPSRPSEETSLNPFMQSDTSLQEAPQNPFLQSGTSLQQALPSPFSGLILSSMDHSPNPFAQPEMSSLDTPPFAQSGHSSFETHPNHFSHPTLPSSASANHTSQFGQSSNGLLPSYSVQSDMSSQVAPKFAQTGTPNPLASQGFPLNYNYHSGPSPQSLMLTQSSLILPPASQGHSPNYVAESGFSLSATQVVAQSGIPSSSLTSQGLVPTQISGLSSQSTNLAQPGLVAAPASQGLHQIYFAQSGIPQATENLAQTGPVVSLTSHGLPPNHSAQSGLSSQAMPGPIQSGLTTPIASPDFPYNSLSGLSSQSTQNTMVSGLLSETTPSITQQGLLTSLASQATLTTIAAPSKTLPAKFETKSTVWADTLSRGLVNLDISGVQTNPLANIGVDFDSINRKDKRVEGKSTAAPVSTITMGKAMGFGSGIGRKGASYLASPPNPMLGPRTGMDMGMNQAMGMGINQAMANVVGMGVGMNMNMNMNIGASQGAAMQPNFGMMTMPGVGYNMTGMNAHGFQRPYGGPY